MSSTTNIPINTRSMNGIITISDGIATMENGNLTDVNTLDANTTNSTIMTTTTQPPGTNNTTVATTAFVNNNLTGYALLNPPTTQTFTGTNTFGVLNANTPTVATNSTRVATTAYVKSNLLNYAVLTPGTAQTFTGENIFDTLRATTPGTSTNSTIVATTAYVKSNLSNYVTTNTTQTITANKTFDGTTTLNNLFVSNYVDVTLTTYENQFYGDIYGYRAVVCQNGLYIKDSPGPGANTYALIDTSGNISTTTTIAATGDISTLSNISAASITLPANSINDSYLSSNIPKKNAANTFTGVNTFNAAVLCNATLKNTASIQVVNPGDFRMLDSTQTFFTQMYQTGTTGVIDAAYPGSKIQIATRNGSNIGLNNLVMELGNHIVLQGSSNEIDITGTAVSLNGVCTFSNAITPVITTTIPTADNSTKIATTAYVKGQGYALLSPVGTQTFSGTNVFDVLQATTPSTAANSVRVATTAYVKSNLLNYGLLTATTQTFTGSNTFTAAAPTAPIVIKNTSSTKSGGLYISAAGNYNAITSDGDFSVIGFGPTIDNGVLNLTTWASNSSGIKIDRSENRFYNPFGAWYNSLTPVPTLNVYDIGFNFISAGATWTNWTGFTTPQNVVTLTFNGVGAYKKGTYLVDIVLITNLSASPSSTLIWTDVGGTSDALNTTCTYASDSALYGSVICQIMRMSFVLQVTTTPSTYYLNYKRIAGTGAGLSENKTNSKISFTRMG